MLGPDWLTQDEIKLLDAIVEVAIDIDCEERHIREISKDEEDD